MAVLPFLKALQVLEETIEIDEPVRIRKPRAFLIVPDRMTTLTNIKAAFENRIAPGAVALRMDDTREDAWTARVRFTCHDANFDKACEIAVAYFDAAWSVFDAEMPHDRRFNDTAILLGMRSEGEIPLSFDGRPGWEILLDLTLFSESLV